MISPGEETASMADISINIAGTMIGFTGTTKSGSDWLQHEVEHEGWQWLGRTLYVDHHFAGDLVSLAQLHGLEVQS
jgi:hypothetical protein